MAVFGCGSKRVKILVEIRGESIGIVIIFRQLISLHHVSTQEPQQEKNGAAFDFNH